jgi:membrane-associated phospholipid phosphatase
LAIATDVLAGAAAGALVIGLLATYLRKPIPALMRTVQLQGTGLLWRFSAL